MTKNEYSKLVSEIDQMLDIQKASCNDDYMHGMYNGMEFIRSMITSSRPIYMDEEGNFDDKDILACPERFI